MVQCCAVYSLLLASQHTITIQGIEAVTLGHGISGDVVGHSFFQSFDRVKTALAKLNSNNDGLVEVNGVQRSINDRLICGFW